MNETLCLVDSNILIRWVQPSDPDYSTVEAALGALARRNAVLCYTSQNLAEFWNACTRPLARNGYGLSPEEADRAGTILRNAAPLTSRQSLSSRGMAQATCCLSCFGRSGARHAIGRCDECACGQANPDIQRKRLCTLHKHRGAAPKRRADDFLNAALMRIRHHSTVPKLCPTGQDWLSRNRMEPHRKVR